MQSIIEDFDDRVIEIEEYLKFLKLVSEPNIKIHGKGRPKSVNVTTLKTMKAQVFLMLYNLVESSVRGAMEELYTEMTSLSAPLVNFEDFAKKLWIDQRVRSIDPFSANRNSYVNLIKNMVDDVILSNALELDPKNIPISGNLDARKIRDLFDLHNIPTKTHYRALQGVELKTVKDKRNALAHGDESFSDCGQQYTVQNLFDIKQQTVIYLRSTLKNVKNYIEKKSYAA